MNRSQPIKIAAFIETSTAYGRGLLRGISRFARATPGWTLYLKPSGKDGAIPNLKNWSVDGLLIRVHDRRLAERVLDAGIPAVDLGYVIPDLFPWRIANDQHKVGQAAADHLLACGLRHFAFCGWGQAHPPAQIYERARLDSFRAQVEKQGLHVNVYDGPKRRHGAEEVARRHLASWLEALPKPVGVMAANDERALDILDAAHSVNIELPAQLALIGVDNDDVLCQATHPTLSSVALNLERIGFEGADLLDRLLRGRAYPRQPITIPPLGVVGRESTDVIAVQDELVASAVRLIHRQIARPLQVNDLLEELHVSRKTLEIRFRAALGRTPYEEILRRRIQRVEQLLTGTDWSMKQIARESGFLHVENLQNVFRREVGQTPGAFRMQHAGIRIASRH